MRRVVVSEIQGRFDVSERRACRFLGFVRRALRYVPQRPLRDAPLRAKLREMAAVYPRWGLPRSQWRLERDGLQVNHKRTERLYRLEGLAVRRRRRNRVAVPRVPRPVVTQTNDTWGIDFVSDQLASGRRFRCFTVVDHCTRESPGLTVAHSLPSDTVIRALETMIAQRGQPARLSLDYGSEFRSRAFDAWAADRGIELLFSNPTSRFRTRSARASTAGSATSFSMLTGSCHSPMRSSTSSNGGDATTRHGPTTPAIP